MSFFPPPIEPLPAGFLLPAFDAVGNPVRAGQLVRIPMIPESLIRDLPAQDVSRLKVVEGKAMPILELDDYGYVWFGEDGPWFCVRPCEVVAVQTDQQTLDA
ncbi:hypothetical protein [Dokdonella soli]|uniref:Uncharacterized protein n=1 Tax=Dokdonella soli TaxID=529810 RepID=A0ABN1J090_9GAMM